MLPAIAAQPFSMAVHELATNAVTWRLVGAHGAGCRRVARGCDLPRAAGIALDLAGSWRTGRCGPPRRGFGSRVLDGTVRGQLGGTLELDWAPGGLICDMEVPLRPG